MDPTAQWADSLLGLERLFFLKVAVWAGLSVLAATALFAARNSGARSAPTLEGLASSLFSVGAPLLVVSLLLRHGAGMRDLASATALDRALWFGAGAAAAVALLALLLTSRVPRGSRAAGWALGVSLHCVALATVALQLARSIVR